MPNWHVGPLTVYLEGWAPQSRTHSTPRPSSPRGVRGWLASSQFHQGGEPVWLASCSSAVQRRLIVHQDRFQKQIPVCKSCYLYFLHKIDYIFRVTIAEKKQMTSHIFKCTLALASVGKTNELTLRHEKRAETDNVISIPRYPGHWRLSIIICISIGRALVSGRELRPRRLPEGHEQPDCQPCVGRTCRMLRHQL